MFFCLSWRLHDVLKPKPGTYSLVFPVFLYKAKDHVLLIYITNISITSTFPVVPAITALVHVASLAIPPVVFLH